MRLNGLFTVALYFVAALLMLFPAVDTALAVLPAHTSTLTWRFGAEGVLGSNLITPLFGWTLLFALVFARGHRRTLRVLSGVALTAATLLLMVALLAALDTLQLRARVRPGQLSHFDIAAVETVVKTSLVGGTLALLALGGWRAGRKRRRHRAESSDAGVLVGSSVPTSSPPPRVTPSVASRRPA